MNARTFALRRLLPLPVVLLGVTVLVFVISRVVPSDPVAVALGEQATPEQREQMRQALGLDASLPVQFLRYLGDLATGDLGTSLVTRRPVAADLGQAILASLELTTLAIVVAVGLGVPLGVAGAVFANRWPDYLSRLVALVGVSMERAWTAVLLQLVVATALGFPIIGRATDPPSRQVTGFYLVDSLLTGDLGSFWDSLRHIVLPAFALSLGALAQIARVARSRMLEERGKEYIRANLAQGLRESVITFKYMLRNALPVTVTVTGLSYGALLGNAFLVETVFGWPGLGQYGVQAILNNDLPAIAGVTLVLGFVFVIVNTLVDVLYAYIDPRVRFS